MTDLIGKSKKRTVFLICVIAAIIVVIVAVTARMTSGSMIARVKRHAASEAGTLAEVADEKIRSEFAGLYNLSLYIADGIMSPEDLNASTVNGNVTHVIPAGQAFDASLLLGDKVSIQGEDVVFSVPVIADGEVQYIVYNAYSEDMFARKFQMSFYNERGKVALTGFGRILVSDGDGVIEDYVSRDEVGKTLTDIMTGVDDKKVVVERCSNGDFIFACGLDSCDMHIIGYVTSEVAFQGVSNVIIVNVAVAVIMILMVIAAMLIYSKYARQAKESRELREAKAKAEKADRSKSEFLARIAHEIRTPVNAITGMNEMIIRESSEDTIKRYAMDVKSASSMLTGVVNDILDASLIDNNRMQIIPEKYDLGKLLNDIISMISLQARQKNLQFKVRISEDIPAKLIGDSMRIRQVLVNLLTNAVKYTQNGAVIFVVNGISHDEYYESLHVEVHDTGVGIKEEDIPGLFEAYGRIDEEHNHGIEGTGLGMNISVRLLKLMGSCLRVDSVYGKGSIFSFDLLQKVAGAERLGDFGARIRQEAEAYEYSVGFTAPDAQILVVDDNEINRKVFRNLLKKTEIFIDEAENGAECLEKIKEKRYDIIFTDSMMHDMEGTEVLYIIKNSGSSRCRDVPVVMFTADVFEGAREHYINEGFAEFLSKPIDASELENMVRQFIPDDKINVQEGSND